MKKIKKLGIKATDPAIDYLIEEWTIDRFLDVAEKVNEIIDLLNEGRIVDAITDAFMNSYCKHGKKNNTTCDDCGRMMLDEKTTISK